MKKQIKIYFLFLLVAFSGLAAQAQTTIFGTVKSKASGETLSAVSVSIKGTTKGTFTDDKGNFKLTVDKLPVTLVVSSVGFEDQEINVTSAATVDIILATKASLGQEVVVSATRVATKILESPVSIERISAAQIRETPQASFYDAVQNLKGVDYVRSGLLFGTIGTRGFNGSGNVRFNQFTDGMDNQAPGLNFSVGNIVGLTELDADNVELLPGASSALYGSGGMNGTLLINSKNPFKYQGLSFQVKQGLMHADARQRSAAPYYDWNFRWGKKISEKFAFKIAGQYIQAQDWQANDLRNYDVVNGTTVFGDRNKPSYNGVNVYGDQIGSTPPIVNMRSAIRGSIFQQAYAAVYAQAISGGATPQQADAIARAQATSISNSQSSQLFATGSDSIISRTGYAERDLVDYNTYNVKFNGGLYYKIKPNLELSLVGYWGSATTVYTGADRYSLKDAQIGQYKIELRGDNFFVKAYTTQENAGKSYAATLLASQMLQRTSESSSTWFPTYIGTWAAARGGTLPGFSGVNFSEDQANFLARQAADANRPLPGSPAFNTLKDQVSQIPISRGGAQFFDKTDMYVVDGMYNFKKITWAEVQVGGLFRHFSLNSQGTLFTDTTGSRIGINELGGYVQIQKQVTDWFKVTVAGRYDKNTNFKGRFTPRATATLKIAKDNFLRLSFQQAYRFPTTQNQYINLPLGQKSNMLIGGLRSLWDFYNFDNNKVWDSATIGRAARGQGPAPTATNAFQYKAFNPEVVNSFEVGYRGVIAKKLLFDAYAYYAIYTNFISTAILVQAPGTPNQRTFGMSVNAAGNVKTFGWGASVDWKVYKGFAISSNVSYNELRNAPADQLSFFNTSPWRYNITVANSKITKNISASATYRWQSQIDRWESTFLQGRVDAFGVLDAQVSFRINKTKNAIKVGANNLLNKYYKTAYANPEIGGLYYVSFGYNIF
ncbi:MAG: TonB-dependent receptor [Chitinophagaceae bacterium]|nr:TonB-dependent receptor [Chitinophagaceae bacterium]